MCRLPSAVCLLLLLLLVAGAGAQPIRAQAPETLEEAAWRAVDWLRQRQAADGGFGDTTTSVAVLHALGDAGESAAVWRSARGVSLRDYLAGQADAFARRDAASAGQLVAALSAAGEDPRAFAGVNVVARLHAHYDPHHGLYGGRVGSALDQAWALLGLASAREAPPPGVVAGLLAWQSDDGGWAGAGGQPDVETTAIVAAALASAGVDPRGLAVSHAVAFLSWAQTDQGAFTRRAGCACAPDSRSTARATAAILAVGRDPLSEGWQRPYGTPPGWLRALQAPDGGLPRHAGDTPDTLSTALAVSALLGRPLPPVGRAPATRSALVWLRQRQAANGGFAANGATADVALTLDAVYALSAVWEDVSAWRAPSGATPLGYLAVAAPTTRAADIGRLIVAVVAVGGDVDTFAGLNLPARLASRRDADSGAYGLTAPDQAWALLALAALRVAPPPGAVAHLASLQADDGGWSPLPGTPTDTVTTALALQALDAVGRAGDATAQGLAYLRQRQQPDAGFSPAPNYAVTTSAATAGAIQVLVAVGEQPDGPPWTRHSSALGMSALRALTPPRALLALQNPDGGFRAQADFAESDAYATVHAVQALASRPHPVRRLPLRLFLPLVGRNNPISVVY